MYWFVCDCVTVFDLIRVKWPLLGHWLTVSPMVRKKKLSPSGTKDTDGQYHNAHLNLHEDELTVAGMSIGDEVFVRVREDKIIIQKANQEEVEHDF